MRFSEFQSYQPKSLANVFVLVCEDDFLVEESRAVWQRIFGGNWVFEKYVAKEFEEISSTHLMDEALTPSLFTQSRALIVTNADKLTKARIDVLGELQNVQSSSLKVILATSNRKAVEGWAKLFPVIDLDPLKPGDVARWLMERYKLNAQIARYLVDNVGTELYQLHNEIEKLRTYVGEGKPIEPRDVDVLILRSEQYGPYELDDAVLASNYKKAVQVVGSMLDEGVDPLVILARVARVWRQLFVGRALVGKRSAKDVAVAAMVPAWKAADFATACRKFDWKRLASGFRLLLSADKAFKTSTPDFEGYFDVMLWKMIG
jgi:DNA polymerase III subunit delta